jgi:hypothetical protein
LRRARLRPEHRREPLWTRCRSDPFMPRARQFLTVALMPATMPTTVRPA